MNSNSENIYMNGRLISKYFRVEKKKSVIYGYDKSLFMLLNVQLLWLMGTLIKTNY